MSDEVFSELVDVMSTSSVAVPAQLAAFADEEAQVRGFDSWQSFGSPTYGS